MPLSDELRQHSFTPEQLEGVRIAFVTALHELGLIERDDPIVRLVAKTIVEVASAGESNPEAIRRHALKQLTFF
jgi:hypothetical protein